MSVFDGRYRFAVGIADTVLYIDDQDGTLRAAFTNPADGEPQPAVTAWTTRTGGTRHTDLLLLDGTPVEEVPVSRGDSAMWGPPGVPTMWLDAGAGRVLAVSPDALTEALGVVADQQELLQAQTEQLAELTARVADLEVGLPSGPRVVEDPAGSRLYSATGATPDPERPRLVQTDGFTPDPDHPRLYLLPIGA